MKTDRPDHWLIVINPGAAGGRGKRRWPQLKESLEERGIIFHHEFSENEGDIRKIVEEGFRNGYRNFGILGGDGSLNSLVNAVMKLDQPAHKLKLALFPAGTGNDWRKTHGIENDPSQPVDLIASGKFVSHDVARIEYAGQSSYFINLLGAGLDAKAVKVYHQRMSGLPFGKLNYVLSLVLALFPFKREFLEIHCDEKEVHRGKLLNLNLGIGRYSGGGMHTIPHARFDDGQLEGVLVSKISVLKILFNIPGLFSGAYIRLREIRTFKGSTIQLHFKSPQWIEADGEMVGPADQYRIKVIPSGIKIASCG